MNHSVTIGGLLDGIGALIGLALLAIGLLAVLAAGMSDSPSAGDSAGKTGCACLLAGAAVLALCIWGLLA